MRLVDIHILAHQANERVEALLEDYDKRMQARQKYVRPTHDLLCSCRKCEPSINTVWRRMNSE